MACGHHEIRIVITNARAVEAFAEAVGIVVDAADDMPWRTDLTEAVKLLRFAAENLTAGSQ